MGTAEASDPTGGSTAGELSADATPLPDVPAATDGQHRQHAPAAQPVFLLGTARFQAALHLGGTRLRVVAAAVVFVGRAGRDRMG